MGGNQPAPNVGMTSIKPDVCKIPPKSQVHLQEVFDNHPTSPSKERAKICFSILDSIIGDLGSHSTVLKVIVEELKNTVYSTAVTSSDTPPFYEKLPYCVLVDRLNKNKVSDEKDKNETIEELRQKLKFRDQDLEIVYRKNLYLKQQLELSEKSKDELNDEIENLKSEIEGKKLEIRDLAQDRVKAEEKLQKEKLILNNSLNQAQQAIEKLTGFKSSNADTLETRSSQAHHTARTKVEITAKGLLNYDIIQAQRIEKQYSEVLDYILDDFEQSLGQVYQKREIMLGVSGKETDDTTEAFNAEIQEVVGTFKGKIDLYLAEGALLNRHIEGLQLQSKRNEANAKLPSIDPTSDFHTRKYGVMLLVSDDGVRFEPHDANQQCVKCGDRVISCPHIEMKSVPFPIKQKYVKLKHPSLYLRSDVKSTEMIKNHQVAHRATEDENPHVTTPLLKIWKQFYAIKGAIKPPSNRSFAIERLIDMIQECYEAKWVDEEQTATEAKRKWEEIKRESPEKEDKLVIVYSRFHEFFYTLMDQRYVYKEISLKACHDIITALEKYEKQSFDVSLFALHISGLQQDTWKYVYLVKRLIHAQVKQDVMDIPTYRKVTRIIYPDRESDHYDQIELEFLSYCQNKLSKEQLLKHFMHLMSKNMDPNFTFFLKQFDKLDLQLTGVLSLQAYIDILTKILPNTDIVEIEARYQLAEKEGEKDQVPIEKLAIISCYLMLNNSFRTDYRIVSQISLLYRDFKSTSFGAESMDHLE